MKHSSDTPSKVLRVIFSFPSFSLKDLNCEFSPCLEIRNLTGEGLFRLLYINNEIALKPALAESWTFSKNNLLIQIKKNIKNSDGISITAADFVESWKKALTSKKFNKARFLFPIIQAKPFFEGQVPFSQVGIKALNPQTLSLTFIKPVPQFLFSLSHPSSWLQDLPFEKGSRSLGPFLIANKPSSTKLILTRNPNYWGIRPIVDQIEITTFSNKQFAMNSFEDKEAHLIFGDIGTSRRENIQLYPTPYRTVLIFNERNRLLRDLNLRKALFLSINKTEWVNTLQQPILLASGLDPFIASPTSSKEIYDPNKAKSLHTAFLKNNLLTSESQTLTLAYPVQLQSIATNLSMQWLKQLNLNIQLTPTGNKETKGDWDMLLTQVKTDAFTLSNGIESLAKQEWKLNESSTAYQLLKSVNQFKNKNFESLEEAYKEFSKLESVLIQDKAIYYPLYNEALTALQQPNLKGLVIDPAGGFNFTNVTF